MSSIWELVTSTAVGQTVRTVVKDLLRRLGVDIGSNGSNEEERRELIHALARAQKEQIRAHGRVEDERGEKEALEERLEQQRRVLNLMDRKGYDRQMLVDRYEEDSTLSVLLVAAADKGEDDENTYLKDKLNDEYNAEAIAGALKIIPPNEVPDTISSDDDVEQWVEDLVESQPDDSSPSGVYFATRKDLSDIYSEIDTDEFNNGWKTASEAIEEVLSINDLQGLINSAPVSPVSLVQDGDLLFLAHDTLSNSEIDMINKHQRNIEKELKHPDLRTLSEEVSVSTMSSALEDYTKKPDKTATALLQEAERIHNQLQESETITTI